MNAWTAKHGWNDPRAVTLRDIFVNARRLIADQDYSVRDAIYESTVNGESDSAAMLELERAGLWFALHKNDVLSVFDKTINGLPLNGNEAG